MKIVEHPYQKKTLEELFQTTKDLNNDSRITDIIIIVKDENSNIRIINNVNTWELQYFMIMQAAHKTMAVARGAEPE